MIEFFGKENQRKIQELIAKNPGIHLSKIAELLTMKISEVETNLLELEKQKLVNVTTDSGYKRYYIRTSDVKRRQQRTVDIREKIYEIIAQNPGVYTSKIAELTGMSTQLTDYHLLHLERKKRIFATKDAEGYYRKYYTMDSSISSDEEKILDALSKRIPFEIMLLLLKHGSMQHKNLARKIKISPSKLSYYLVKLLENKILDVQPYGKEKGYMLKNREEVLRILRRYQQKITSTLAVEEFTDVWDDFNFK